MASELVASLGPLDFQRETDLGNDPSVVVCLSPGEGNPGGSPAGDIRGLSLPKYVRGSLTAYGYTTAFRIPGNLTMGTGLTFKIYVSDDGQNAIDLGTVIVLGVTLKRLAANATLDVDTGGATEQTVNITLSSTSAGVAIGSLAIASANLPTSLAVGDLVLMRIRRVGTSTSDTCPGRALCYRVEVQNT